MQTERRCFTKAIKEEPMIKVSKATMATIKRFPELYNEGYRKASDVAEEIFEEIENFIIDQCSLTNGDVKQIYTKVRAMRKHYREKGK